MADMKTSSTELSKLPPGVGGGKGGPEGRAGLREGRGRARLFILKFEVFFVVVVYNTLRVFIL